jgi:glycosyltransferase involved in cell wall biosynthesis
MTPFVSIIVPALNRRELLRQLVESVEALRYPRDRFEAIVVDNGSTDGTLEMLEQTAARAPFVLRYIRNESASRVPSVSRNIGIANARGEILAFTDSDCLVSPQWLSEGVAGFGENVAIVQGRTIPHGGQQRPVLHHTVNVDSRKTYAETCNIFYRRDAVERAGRFDEKLTCMGGEAVWGEDTDLAYRVRALGYRMAFREGALVTHQIVRKSFRSWLLEPLRVWPWPQVVKRHPLIREELLFGRIFYTRMTALFDLLLLGAVLGLSIHPVFLSLALPFLVSRYRDGGDHLNGVLRVARVFGGSLRAFLLFCTLVCGSVRFRALVL